MSQIPPPGWIGHGVGGDTGALGSTWAFSAPLCIYSINASSCGIVCTQMQGCLMIIASAAALRGWNWVFFFSFFFFPLSGSYCVCEALRAGMWETVVIKVFCNSIKDSPPPSAPTALPSYTYSLLQELCSPASAAWALGLCCLTNVRTGCVENGGFVTWKCAGKRVYEVEKKTVKWNKWGIAVPQRAANVVSTQRWDTHYGRESFFIGCYQVTVHRRWMDDNYVDENLTYPYWQE